MSALGTLQAPAPVLTTSVIESAYLPFTLEFSALGDSCVIKKVESSHRASLRRIAGRQIARSPETGAPAKLTNTHRILEGDCVRS